MRNNTKKLTSLALTVSFALILSFIESRIPAFTAIPGIKVGLANIAVIFTLYKFGIKEAVAISLVRVILVSMLFGSPVSLIYSLTGAVLSLSVMFLLKSLTPLSEVGVSVAGGVTHNIGQIGAASIMLGTNVVVYYLPFLLLSGTIAGVVVGIASALLIKRVKLDIGKQGAAKASKAEGIILSKEADGADAVTGDQASDIDDAIDEKPERTD